MQIPRQAPQARSNDTPSNEPPPPASRAPRTNRNSRGLGCFRRGGVCTSGSSGKAVAGSSTAASASAPSSTISTGHIKRYPTLATVSMSVGDRASSPNAWRSLTMLRVRELSVTSTSSQTILSNSSLVTTFCGLRSRTISTRNARGSTGTLVLPLKMQNSRSRTSNSAKRKTRGFSAIVAPSQLVHISECGIHDYVRTECE